MRADPLRWRPLRDREALEAERRAQSAMAEWQSDWFTRGNYALSPASRLAPRAVVDSRQGVVYQNGDLTVVLFESEQNLLDDALGFIGKRPRMSDSDAELLNQFQEALVTALTQRIQQKFNLPATAVDKTESAVHVPYGALSFNLDDARGRVLGQLILHWQLIQHIDTPRPHLKRPALTTALQQLIQTAVQVEVRVGQTTMRFDELQALSVGDVVVLDRRVSEQLVCIEPTHHTVIGRAQVYRDGGRLVARLT